MWTVCVVTVVGSKVTAPVCLWSEAEASIKHSKDVPDYDLCKLVWAYVHCGGHSLEEWCVIECKSCDGVTDRAASILVSESGADTGTSDAVASNGHLGSTVVIR